MVIETDNQNLAQAVSKYASYADEMDSVLSIALKKHKKVISKNQIKGFLNGEATAALEDLVPVAVRKKGGIFFTSADLSDKVASHLAPILRDGAEITDPACGAGNLLLACTKYLPIGQSLDDTLKIWSRIINGYDLYPEFIRAARLRLILSAINIHWTDHNTFSHINPINLFRRLKVGDAFSLKLSSRTKCFVINPPFGYMDAPKDCHWSSGKIQIAGWFVEKLLKKAKRGQHLVAILPDVLNSGTRYKKWRDHVSSLVSTLTIEPAGRFAPNTDVDVFILHAVAGPKINNKIIWPTNTTLSNNESFSKIDDYFEVHVGAVVPHRDPLKGKYYPYIHSRNAIPWHTLEHISEKRKTIHNPVEPPFVVVHRTSSPSDKHRCKSTIINEKRKVAVENHLLVLTPRDRTVKSCQYLLSLLKSKETNEWFNQRIRCRHLTVSSMRELPYHP